ncbi:unnamed protein product [Peniophora sp. CBMAI 1063]|nr:unnamed protein product [Peniophora sp. CBMAI 1063]
MANRDEGTLLSVEVLDFSTPHAKRLHTPNLLQANLVGPITLHAPKLLRTSVTGPLPQSSLLRSLELRWPLSRCVEIPVALSRLPCLEEFALDLVQSFTTNQVNIVDSVLDQGTLSFPALTTLRVSGYDVIHPLVCQILTRLIATSDGTLKQIEIACTDADLTGSDLALKVVKSAAHAIEVDSVFIHFKEVYGRISATMSLSRQELRNEPGLNPCVTLRFTLTGRYRGPTVEEQVNTNVMPLLPLDRITHLFLGCIPMSGSCASTESAFIAAFKHLTFVHTLHASDNDRDPSKHSFLPITHPLVGEVMGRRCLPALKTMNVYYTTYMFRDWWTRLATAVAMRRRTGMPLSSLRISYKWGSNVQRPKGAARSLLETFHELPDENWHHDPDSFVLKCPADAFNVDGVRVWAKEKVESVAKSLFAEVIEGIEVEEASGFRAFWPPKS